MKNKKRTLARKGGVSLFKKITTAVKNNLFVILLAIAVTATFTLASYVSETLEDDAIMFTRNGYACSWGEFKEIRSAAYEGLKKNATKECSKKRNVTITPIALLRPYALANVAPDMKNCITDEAWMVLEKKDGEWKFLVIGTDPGIVVPFFAEETKKDNS